MSRPLLALALLATLALSIEAQPPFPRVLLLRLDETTTSSFACDGNHGETLIFGDGLVIRQTLEDTGILRIRRQAAPGSAVGRLGAALAASRVGFLRGNCASDNFTPNASFTTTITWFGLPPRKSRFVVASALEPYPPCAAATNALYDELIVFLGEAERDPLATATRLQLTPAPGCEGPQP